ncbi:MAG: hypothetical protein AB7O39_14530 [Flavobacteriaceae bacterium]
MRRSLGVLALGAAALVTWPHGLAASQAEDTLALELNRMEPSDKGCRVTFVVHNGLGAALEKAAYEIVLFDRNGLVGRLMILDFQDLPADKTKVRQFDLSGTECDDIGRVLVNSASECKGERLTAKDCIGSLRLSTRAGIEFGS